MTRLQINKLNLPLTFDVRVVLALGGIVGACIVWFVSSPFGIGLSPDSVGYIAVARNIAARLGVVSYDLLPFVQQPPLYPALLALPQIVFGLDPLVSARILNALLFSGIVFLAGVLLDEYTENHVVAVLGAIVVLVSPVLVRIAVMAWSEALFVFLVLLFLWVAHFYLASHTLLNSNFVWLAVLATLACLTRYIGISLVLTGLLVILVQPSPNRTRKFAALGLFTVVSLLPLALWLFGNYTVSQTLMGERAPSEHTLIENLALTFNTLVLWYLPNPFWVQSLILVPVVLGCVYFVWVQRKRLRHPFRGEIKILVPPVGFIVLYLSLLLISSTTTEFDDIGDRLLAPLFVPVTILVLVLITKLWGRLEQATHRRVAGILLAGVMGIWLLYPAGETWRFSMNVMNRGIGFNNNAWQASSLIKYMLANPLDANAMVYSNAPDAVYLFTHRNARMSPAMYGERAVRYQKTLAQDAPPWSMTRGAYFVWSTRTGREYLYTPNALSTHIELEPIVRVSDGAVYRVGSSKK